MEVNGEVDISKEGFEIYFPADQKGSIILLTVEIPLLGSGILIPSSNSSFHQLYSFYSSGSKNLNNLSSIASISYFPS